MTFYSIDLKETPQDIDNNQAIHLLYLFKYVKVKGGNIFYSSLHCEKRK